MTQAQIDIVWVVPCFDEAARLKRAAFLGLTDGEAPARLLFVDDGSADGTLGLVQGLVEERPGRIEVLGLPRNQGKAEAVRLGLRRALDAGAQLLGYVDADLATPPAELLRLAELMRNGDYDVLMGARVQLLGRSIQRSHLRHYVGRAFATCASLSLGLPVYDTQCGAKLFRPTAALAAALARPFASRWAFDVELLGRLLQPGPGTSPVDVRRIREEPLHAWTDVPGSKLGLADALRGGLDLLRVAWHARRH
jgi:dolichyl-phosphate beta-glucosyltransferase